MIDENEIGDLIVDLKNNVANYPIIRDYEDKYEDSNKKTGHTPWTVFSVLDHSGNNRIISIGNKVSQRDDKRYYNYGYGVENKIIVTCWAVKKKGTSPRAIVKNEIKLIENYIKKNWLNVDIYSFKHSTETRIHRPKVFGYYVSFDYVSADEWTDEPDDPPEAKYVESVELVDVNLKVK